MTTEQFEEWLDVNKLKHETHQKIAVEWCLRREMVLDKKGGIIADEMGLGKTIEILGTMYCNQLPNTLIVLPYSLLGQWVDIITNLFHRAPLVYHGTSRKRLTEEEIQLHTIVLTTYGLINQKRVIIKNPLAPGSPLCNIKWSRIIYDEAHHLRNKKTAVHSGALLLNTDITWLLTGTPIQNRKQDLYNLFTLLGFKTLVDIKINTDLYIQTYMLRRNKADAGIVLPACHTTIVNVSWKYKKEQKMAENIHSKLSFSNLQGDANALGCTHGHLKLLTDAKKICVLPRLLKKHKKIKYVLEDDGPTPMSILKNLDSVNQTSKLESVVKHILERKGNGKPKLVFCYFHKEIDELVEILKKHEMNVKKIDGRTSKTERTNILKGPCEVLIGQIEATNEGLNLQAYKEIYIVSPNWNPAVEDQAIARCHRIGQTEEVNVFHFLMTGYPIEMGPNEMGPNQMGPNENSITLDQHICNVQEKKRTIIKNMLDPD